MNQVSLFLLCSATLLACGGDDIPSDLSVCEANQFIVHGDVAGLSFQSKTSSSGGGFSQDDGGGDFGSQNNTREVDPSVPDLNLTWANSLSKGESASILGTIALPASMAGGGQTLCIGAGSTIYSVGDGELRFRLTGLKSGNNCEREVSGKLLGCWRAE